MFHWVLNTPLQLEQVQNPLLETNPEEVHLSCFSFSFTKQLGNDSEYQNQQKLLVTLTVKTKT